MRGRKVQGVILFVDHSLDPRTEPWCHFVSVHSLADTLGRLAAEHPAHPLVAVFLPLMQELEQEAGARYNPIATSGLDEPLKSVLLEVFINWLEQRFVEKGKAEIEMMLVGQLPALRETQSGKDLIAIGVQEGIERGIEKGIQEGIETGKRQSLVQVLESRFGPIDSALIEQVETIKGPELLDKFFRRALNINSLDQLFHED